RKAGAIFIAKTNTPEFGLGSQTYNPVFGATGCAYDPSLTAGGSSGGAAASLALHLVPVADGSDMMGSLRNPGAYNNVIGFRPSIGRVPGEPGDEQFYSRLGVSGPMGRNVEDTIKLLCTMAGSAPFDPRSGFEDKLDVDAFRPKRFDEVKIGWLGDYGGYLETEPGILSRCEAGLAKMASNGGVVEPVSAEFDMTRLWKTWLDLRNWSRVAFWPFYDDPKKRALMKPELNWEIEQSRSITGADLYRAANTRSDWFRALNKLFDKYEFLALPTAQVFSFSKETHWPKSINDKAMDTYHRWMEVVIGPTLAGLPTANVPVGFDDRGRAMGMQIFGRFGEDRAVLELASAYEGIVDWLSIRPKLPS
ncbi:MAG TPA: amidase, partial [Amphiplicatus sp.]|nr:amidase [Amphiplicatus sp.]